ncbi:ExbD/TolR family protein [Puniceibacterium sediminis]|uniref:Outer membrane transport energization protein ExbD n=1 Tax=Puniceibacterium sediminis TaxID=1608407 RepID=A0A239A1C8_9RHOB|nr:biopolymer transporter ExbD [Puniceibacterium sediminis]SNR88824.1 outer membrane transport energization protein ExbD [Puniceibacterium sediminis]
MQIEMPPSRPRSENILPMINVVFLLLIFFLISARLTAPEPFPVTPPVSTAEGEAEGEIVLFLAEDGRLGFREFEGEEPVMVALAAARVNFCAQADCADAASRPPLQLRADAGVPAAQLARLMPVLGGLGFGRVDLVVTAQ